MLTKALTMLTILIEVLGGALIGAGMFWLRGSAKFAEWVGRGKTTADLLWAISMGLVAAWAGMKWYGAVAVCLGLWLGARPGWWQSLSLGRNAADGPEGLQYLRHATRGMLWVAGGAFGAWLGGASYVPLLIAGLMCVPAYVAGYALREGDGSPYTNPTAVGEMLFGAAIGAAVVAGPKVTWGVSTWPL